MTYEEARSLKQGDMVWTYLSKKLVCLIVVRIIEENDFNPYSLTTTSIPMIVLRRPGNSSAICRVPDSVHPFKYYDIATANVYADFLEEHDHIKAADFLREHFSIS